MFIWDVDPVLVHLGPVSIRYYGVFFLAGVLGACGIFLWQWRRGGRSVESGKVVVLLILLGLILGARLGELLFYQTQRFLADPLGTLFAWEGGLSSHGAAIGMMIAMVLFSLRSRIPLWEVLDRLAMPIMLVAACVRIGNFFNSEIVGRITHIPWGVKLPRHDLGLPIDQVPLRHPTQLYEVALGLGVLFLLWWADRRAGKEDRPQGLLFSLMLVFYFSGRFGVEFLKEFQTLDPARHGLTMGQHLSIPFLLLGAVGLLRLRAARRVAPQR